MTDNAKALSGLSEGVRTAPTLVSAGQTLVDGLAHLIADLDLGVSEADARRTLEEFSTDLQAWRDELAHALAENTPAHVLAEAVGLPVVQTLGPADGVPTPTELAAQERGELLAGGDTVLQATAEPEPDTLAAAVADGPVLAETTASDLQGETEPERDEDTGEAIGEAEDGSLVTETGLPVAEVPADGLQPLADHVETHHGVTLEG